MTPVLQPTSPHKNILSFTLVSALGGATGLILLPVYLAYLPAEAYAVVVLTWLLANLAGAFSNLKLDQAMRSCYFDHIQDKKRLNQFNGSIFTCTWLSSVAALLIFNLLAWSFWQDWFQDSAFNFLPAGLLAVTSVILNQASSVYYAYLQNTQNLRQYRNLKLGIGLISCALQWYLLATTQLGLLSVFIGAGIAAIANATLVIVLVTVQVKWRWHWATLRPSLHFSLPMIAFSLLFLLDRQADRILLEKLLPLAGLGHYALLAALAGGFMLLYNALDSGVRSQLYMTLTSSAATTMLQRNVKSLHKLYFMSGCMVLVLLLLAGAIVSAFGLFVPYQPAFQLLPLFLIALLPLPAIRWGGLLLLHEKKSSALTWLTLIKLLCHCTLLWLLVPQWQLKGAIASLLFGNILSVMLFYSQLSKEMRYHMQLTNLPNLLLAVGLILACGSVYLAGPGIAEVAIAALFGLAALIFTLNSNNKMDQGTVRSTQTNTAATGAQHARR